MLQGARDSHGCCEIDEHRMIILGGSDDGWNVLSSGFIYNSRTEQSSPLPNDMPETRFRFCAVANKRYVYVIGGMGAYRRVVNTVYRLSLETFEWTTMAPMGTARYACAGVLLDDYLYIFGGSVGIFSILSSVERYSIIGNTWEDLPRMAAARWGHCAVAAMRNKIYILGGYGTRVLEVFDAALLEWNAEARLCDMPAMRSDAAAVVLKNKYLVVIGGEDEGGATAGCLMYDCSINQWSSTPTLMHMITARHYNTAAVLDGKIVVAGGLRGRRCLSSMECIDTRDILEYAPLEYPLSQLYFDQILQLGKALLLTKHT